MIKVHKSMEVHGASNLKKMVVHVLPNTMTITYPLFEDSMGYVFFAGLFASGGCKEQPPGCAESV
jgi:hypothetical protein